MTHNKLAVPAAFGSPVGQAIARALSVLLLEDDVDQHFLIVASHFESPQANHSIAKPPSLISANSVRLSTDSGTALEWTADGEPLNLHGLRSLLDQSPTPAKAEAIDQRP